MKPVRTLASLAAAFALSGCASLSMLPGGDNIVAEGQPVPECGKGWAPVADRPGSLTCKMQPLGKMFPVLDANGNTARPKRP